MKHGEYRRRKKMGREAIARLNKLFPRMTENYRRMHRIKKSDQ